jgi:hypothetical protein
LGEEAAAVTIFKRAINRVPGMSLLATKTLWESKVSGETPLSSFVDDHLKSIILKKAF